MASCPDCKKGAVLPGEPSGTMVKDAYFAAGPEGNTSRAVVLLTDIFGLPLVNSKIIADNISKRVPDLFNGKPPITVEKLKVPERVGERIQWIPLIFNLLPSIPAMVRNRPSVAYGRVEAFVKNLKAEKKYEKLGAVGYCFGGTLGVMIIASVNGLLCLARFAVSARLNQQGPQAPHDSCSLAGQIDVLRPGMSAHGSLVRDK